MKFIKKISIILLITMVFNFLTTIIFKTPVKAIENISEIKEVKEYIIYSRSSNKCLEPTNFSTENETKIRQWDYWGDSSQRWKLTSTGDGYYYITNVYSGKAIDIPGKSTELGVQAQIYTKNSGTNQQWKLESTGDGYFYIRNRNSNQVLDIKGKSVDNGGLCIQYNQNNNTNQQFKIISNDNLTSDFNNLSQDEIVSAMGAGWNLGNQLEANLNGTPSETAWGNPVIAKSLIKAVKNAGFKTIRIPVSYLNKIGAAPNYTIDSTWLNRIQEVVNYAYDEGMYVIINVHGDGYNSVQGGWLLCNGSNQIEIKNKYEKVWKQIADRFKNYDEHLIFESMNEEFDGTYGTPNLTYYQNINTYNQIFVDTVRKTGSNNTARWLLIPGWNTDIDYTSESYGFKIPTDSYRSDTISSSQKRIMISVHYYSPWDFCGDESSNITQWGATATNSSKKSTWGQEDYLNNQFNKLYTNFVSKGYPVVIGEFGAIDKTYKDSTNNTYRAKFAYQVCLIAKKYKCVPVVWDNGHNGDNGFGLFNRSTYTVTQQEIINSINKAINN